MGFGRGIPGLHAFDWPHSRRNRRGWFVTEIGTQAARFFPNALAPKLVAQKLASSCRSREI